MNILRIVQRFSQNHSYRLTEQGSGFSYQINLYSNDKITSFWHDVPIYPIKEQFNIINVGIEIPKERLAKFEVSKTIKYNPIVQDKKTKKNSDEKELRYYAQFAPYNYGFIPQTWENSTINLHEGFKGDDDPLDILDLSMKKVFKPGDIFQAKIIGAFCVLDQDEVDWKILVLNTEEADQLKINEFNDYEKKYPDLGRYMLNRFRYIKTFDGKKENQILFNNQIFDAKRAVEIVKEGHQQYQDLLQNPNLKMKRQEFLITN
ncbi:unnamed protein product [Paramecium sonneborni]|uniref:Inorganic diphosphatase n=1 Tax=Paramecium sonneborni TaxID=65129 RepID=A0A8S1KCX6_9CILI|nr:unnamed protein product [Paramecium sonneborni]